jgi:hypothetical protein
MPTSTDRSRKLSHSLAPERRYGAMPSPGSPAALHSFVASRAFSLPIDEVTGELRRRVKAMSYGLATGCPRTAWPRS